MNIRSETNIFHSDDGKQQEISHEKEYSKLSGLISQDFLFELKHTIDKFHESSVGSGFPLFPEHGLAILGAESYKPPLVMCISIPLPRTVAEARRMYNSWGELESKMLQLPSMNLSTADIRNKFVNDTIDELYRHGVNSAYIQRLGEYWVYHLKSNGISFDEQVKRNKKREVTGHFSLITKSNKCYLLSEEVGYRTKGVSLE